jgi:hypothetical protein
MNLRIRKMIQREKRIKIWYLIRRITKKLGIVDIPKETEVDYWEYMKVPDESVRYLLIEHFNLDTGFFYHAYEESDLKGITEQEKMKEMWEDYFATDEGSGGELLLIDIKTLKAYTLNKEIKYVKKAVK